MCQNDFQLFPIARLCQAMPFLSCHVLKTVEVMVPEAVELMHIMKSVSTKLSMS